MSLNICVALRHFRFIVKEPESKHNNCYCRQNVNEPAFMKYKEFESPYEQ
jgi:hypothetical protein